MSTSVWDMYNPKQWLKPALHNSYPSTICWLNLFYFYCTIYNWLMLWGNGNQKGDLDSCLIQKNFHMDKVVSKARFTEVGNLL